MKKIKNTYDQRCSDEKDNCENHETTKRPFKPITTRVSAKLQIEYPQTECFEKRAPGVTCIMRCNRPRLICLLVQ